jgi:hypothetical protein
MKTIAIRDAATLLYLKGQGTALVRELTAFLTGFGLKASANYTALSMRNLEDRGWVELIASGVGVNHLANLWRLTPEGQNEAAAL